MTGNVNKNNYMITIKGVKYEEVKEYAKLKGVTVKTVYEWIKDGRVKTRKLLNLTIVKL